MNGIAVYKYPTINRPVECPRVGREKGTAAAETSCVSRRHRSKASRLKGETTTIVLLYFWG